MSSKLQTENHYRWLITLRVLLAILGGYLLTNLASILLAYVLPLSKSDAVMTALLLSFVIYTCVVLRVFSVRSLRKVFLEMLCITLLTGIAIVILKLAGVAP